jgi:16S rRNA C1402 (ribose-2'-O) methylase RsmI
VRGEVVLVVAGATALPETERDVDIEGEFARLQAQGRTRREAVKQLAKKLGLRARDVYGRLIGARPEES